jgi:hypothetical protein
MKSRSRINKTQKSRFYRALVATAFLANGIFQFVAPALAEGTTAGTVIDNRATATYEDPNDPDKPLNTTSNTVTVTIAEVAGITVEYTGVEDTTNTNVGVQVNDQLIFNYTITNVGNDPTGFRIPNLASTTGPATVSGTLPGGTANNLQYSLDNGTTWTNITGSDVTVPNIPVGGQVLVRVPVTVQPGAQPGDVITVKLGNTPANAQNVLRSPDGGDVYTVDNADGSPGEVAGAPVNGTREASDTSINVPVGSTVKTYSLATILKTRTNYSNGGTTNTITDDTLTYGLSLRVEGNDPTGQGITPTALEGTTINVDGNPATHILISDAIPTGLDLTGVVAPSGWTAVYTTDPVTTDANAAVWSTIAPANLATVTRVGFINNPATITSVAPNQTVTGFTINLRVEAGATSPLNVANIAQVFGQTPGTNAPVYDESGDQNPSNFDGQPGNMTPPPGTDTNSDGVPDTLPGTSVDDGFIDNPATPETGVDGNNDNTGVGQGGEANIFTVEVPVNSAVLNGPVNAPDAIGPSGTTNDDFTNKSSLVPAGTAPGSTLNPQAVAFTNTIRNNGTDPSSYSLVPTPPATPGDLPTGTLVTITYASESRAYVWDGTNFLFDVDGNPATTGDQSAIDALNEYITIPNVPAGTNVNYGVEIDLPAGTPLSTDIDRGFPVPITAFVDDATPGLGSETVRNTTIDRVYTGYLKLRKLSRILDANGQPVAGADGQLSADPKRPVPGNIIEYVIQYSNISEPQSGNGNIILNASNVVITEDGVTLPNNWALDNDGNGLIDTSNIIGSAIDPNGNIQFFNGNPATTSGSDQTGTTVNTDVTRYVNNVTGQVTPGQLRTFTFRRKVN